MFQGPRGPFYQEIINPTNFKLLLSSSNSIHPGKSIKIRKKFDPENIMVEEMNYRPIESVEVVGTKHNRASQKSVKPDIKLI